MQPIVHSAHSAEFLCAPIVTSKRYHGHKIIEHMHWHANGSKVNASLCGTEESVLRCRNIWAVLYQSASCAVHG